MNAPKANASTMAGTGASQSEPTSARATLGPPPMHTFIPNPLDEQPLPSGNAMKIVAGTVGLGVLVVGVGMLFGNRARPAVPAHTSVPMTSYSRTGAPQTAPQGAAPVVKDESVAPQAAAANPSGEPPQHANGEGDAGHGG